MTATFADYVAEQDARNTIHLKVVEWCHDLIDALKQNYVDSAVNGHILSSLRDPHSAPYHRRKVEELRQGVIPIDYVIESGKKYHKIVFVDGGGSRSVHCFVDKKTGEMYKSASWRSPAKGVRYDLRVIKEREFVMNNADWSGGYLYMDNVVGFNYKRG